MVHRLRAKNTDRISLFYARKISQALRKRTANMRKLLSTLALLTLTATAALAADISLSWTNGDNPGATTAWKTIVFYSFTTGAGPTNYVGTMTNSWPTSFCTVTNLQAGRRYYFTVYHSDLEDLSPPSNEANGKTKLNPPKNASAVAQ